MCGCREFVQAKTGQDLPKEGPDSVLDEVLGSICTHSDLHDVWVQGVCAGQDWTGPAQGRARQCAG